jgi:hypothetical protein
LDSDGLVMDSDGVECYRIDGYLPKNWFRARLEMGLARVEFMHKKFADAEKSYAAVIERRGDTGVVPEAIYWRGVCHYKARTITPCSAKSGKSWLKSIRAMSGR